MDEKKSFTKSVKYYSGPVMTPYEFLLDSQYSNLDQDDNFTGQIGISPEMLQSLTEQFNRLYISGRKKYLVQNLQQIAVDKAFTFQKKPLTDLVLQDHLLGKHTIACYPCSESSTKWFLFDVDVELSGEKAITLAKQTTKKLIRVLKSYVPENFIHCYRSGSKGYHVVIYLDGPYHREIIKEFQELIIRLAGLDQLEKCKIEIRPLITDINKNGQTAKLPLGRNFLNQEHGSNFCCYVDIRTLEVKKKLEYMPGQFKYFLSIKQLDRSIFKECIKKVRDAAKKAGMTIQIKQSQPATKVISHKRQDNLAKFCEVYQITAKGQRHNMTFDLAVKLKTFQQLSEKQTTSVLLDWLDTQEGKYGSSKEEAEKDTRFQATYVYSKGYEYRGRLVETVTLTEADVAFFADIRNLNDQIGPMERNAMTVLVAFIRHAKLFMSNEFYISYNKIMELTDVRRNAINPCLGRLETLGKIEIVERVDFTRMIPHANIYKIIHPVDVDEVQEGYVLRYDSKINILDIFNHFYYDKQLKKMLTQSLYNSVLE